MRVEWPSGVVLPDVTPNQLLSVTEGQTTANEPSPPAEGVALEQNHPNPLRSATLVRYRMPQPGLVRVEVFDALGRRVVVLHDGEVAAGAHTLVLDGAALPAGVYAVRVVGERFLATRRATLLR